MKNDIERIATDIEAYAVSKDMRVFPDVPDIAGIPAMVTWPGDWKSYIDTALCAKTTVLYLVYQCYNPQLEIEGAIKEVETGAYSIPSAHDENFKQLEWFRERISERITQWDKYLGKAACLYAYWFQNNVAHAFHITADWYIGVADVIRTALEDAEVVWSENRTLRSAEESLQLVENAKQMAHHERFADAKSEAKRIYMATQLFPSEDPRVAQHIASYAALYHWWHLEPGERTSTEDKVNALYQEGQTINNISAILNIPVTRVKKYLK